MKKIDLSNYDDIIEIANKLIDEIKKTNELMTELLQIIKSHSDYNKAYPLLRNNSLLRIFMEKNYSKYEFINGRHTNPFDDTIKPTLEQIYRFLL